MLIYENKSTKLDLDKERRVLSTTHNLKYQQVGGGGGIYETKTKLNSVGWQHTRVDNNKTY